MAGLITKALVASVVLLPCVLAYESWHGKMYLEDAQRSFAAKFPDLRAQLKAPEPIADQDNFWKSPHMAQFRRPQQQQVKDYGNVEVMDVRMGGLALDRWNNIPPPSAPESRAEAIERIAGALRKDGVDVPADTSAAQQTIAALLTSEDAWQALNAAASICPAAEMYPSLKQRNEITLASGAWCVPTCGVQGVHGAAVNLANRAVIAIAIGRPDVALQNVEIIQRFAEGYCQRGGGLIDLIMGASFQSILVGAEAGEAPHALPTLIRSGSLTEEQLAKLHSQLATYDEDAMVIDRGFLREARIFTEQVEKGKDSILSHEPAEPTWKDALTPIAVTAWYDSNVALMADVWGQALVPNTAEDDLQALAKSLPTLSKHLRDLNKYSPRSYLTQIAMPATSNIVERSLACQTARRQLLVAIAAHRYRLAQGYFPERQEQMVPQFLPALERDPHAKGKLMTYQRTAEGFEVTSADPNVKFTQSAF